MSFDETKPPFGGLLVSADHRANFLATRRASFINLLRDPLFECWPVNDTTTPPDWSLSGAGATIARDTTLSRLGVGDMGARVTRGAANALLEQELLIAADYDPFFDTRVATAGVFVHASAAGIARARIDDGVSSNVSAVNAAANTLEFLPLEHQINAAATSLRIGCDVIAPGSCTFSGAVFLFSDIKPDRFYSPITVPVNIPFERRGPLFVGQISVWPPSRSFVIREGIAQLFVNVPAGQAAIFDLEQWDGVSAWASMFTGGNRPTIPPSSGSADISAPDASYNLRCFAPNRTSGGGTPGKGQIIRGAIDQVGITPNEGDSVVLVARGKGWASPMEIFRGF